MYNENLAFEFEQFTKNQLTQLFWECWAIVRKSSGNDSPADIQITAIIGDFHAYFSDGLSPDADAIDSLYEAFITALDAVSEGQVSHCTSLNDKWLIKRELNRQY